MLARLTGKHCGRMWVIQSECFLKPQEVHVVSGIYGRWNTEDVMRYRNAATQARIVLDVINSASTIMCSYMLVLFNFKYYKQHYVLVYFIRF